jgi:hypothetical protein
MSRHVYRLGRLLNALRMRERFSSPIPFSFGQTKQSIEIPLKLLRSWELYVRNRGRNLNWEAFKTHVLDGIKEIVGTAVLVPSPKMRAGLGGGSFSTFVTNVRSDTQKIGFGGSMINRVRQTQSLSKGRSPTTRPIRPDMQAQQVGPVRRTIKRSLRKSGSARQQFVSLHPILKVGQSSSDRQLFDCAVYLDRGQRQIDAKSKALRLPISKSQSTYPIEIEVFVSGNLTIEGASAGSVIYKLNSVRSDKFQFKVRRTAKPVTEDDDKIEVRFYYKNLHSGMVRKKLGQTKPPAEAGPDWCIVNELQLGMPDAVVELVKVLGKVGRYQLRVKCASIDPGWVLLPIDKDLDQHLSKLEVTDC